METWYASFDAMGAKQTAGIIAKVAFKKLLGRGVSEEDTILASEEIDKMAGMQSILE